PRDHQPHRDAPQGIECEETRPTGPGGSNRRSVRRGPALTPPRRSATEAVLQLGARHRARTLFMRRGVFKSICIFSGHANPALADQIASYLEVPLGRAKISTFADGEVFAEVKENVRGLDVYVVQPTSAPVNDHLMQLLVMIDALKRASAGSITAVIPYYGYARQDRKVAPRTPITAKLVADLLQ